MALSIQRVTVMVDWDSTKRVVPRPSVEPIAIRQEVRHIERVFEKLRPVVAALLNKNYAGRVLSVHWRVYHGWYSGKTKTNDCRAFEMFASNATSLQMGSVSFGSNYSASTSMYFSNDSTVFDTLRYRPEPIQKMVDTQLVADLLCAARSEQNSIFLVIADDDDFYPGLAVAHYWNSSIHLLQRRQHQNSHLDQRAWITSWN